MCRSWNIVWRVDVGSACVDIRQSPSLTDLLVLLLLLLLLFTGSRVVQKSASLQARGHGGTAYIAKPGQSWTADAVNSVVTCSVTYIHGTKVRPSGLFPSSLLGLRDSTVNPEKPFIWGQKVKGQGHESQKQYRRWSLHSCECWLLFVYLWVCNLHKRIQHACWNPLCFSLQCCYVGCCYYVI